MSFRFYLEIREWGTLRFFELMQLTWRGGDFKVGASVFNSFSLALFIFRSLTWGNSWALSWGNGKILPSMNRMRQDFFPTLIACQSALHREHRPIEEFGSRACSGSRKSGYHFNISCLQVSTYVFLTRDFRTEGTELFSQPAIEAHSYMRPACTCFKWTITTKTNMLFQGQTTTHQASEALHRIQWRIRHNVFTGFCPDDALFRSTIPSADAEGGRFEIVAGFMAGSQKSIIDWCKDENQIVFRLYSVSEPI